MLSFASFSVPRGRLHCRPLQMAYAILPKDQVYSKRPLAPAARHEFHWWLKALTRSTPIHLPPVAHFLTTDASGTGWGAVIDGVRSSGGSWLPDQKHWHSNLKEMWAIIQAVQAHQPILRNSNVLIQSDNKSVVSYIRNEGGLRSKNLYLMAHMLFQILDRNNILVIPHHIPGQYNVEADMLSRQKLQAEWTLTHETYQEIFHRFGKPQIDLFASKNAHVLPRYVTRDCSDHAAEYHDAFSREWHYVKAWIFPPPHLVPRVLAHLNKAKGIYMMVVPRWHKVFWRPDLKRRAIGPPWTLRNLRNKLIDTRTQMPPAQVDQMCLEVWSVKGGTIY
ncbi:hypothetical protein NE865_07161 [Phthorimaea operculella]|nr:hypothetical protein NE865_07161 [Phthorimaea operculella]